MFWKKKPATEGPAPAKAEKLPRPRSIEELVGRQMVVDLKRDPDWVWQLRSVVRQRAGGAHRFDFRVFSDAQVAAKKLKVKDYTSFDTYPELVLCQGWFDKDSMEAHFEEKPQAAAPVTGASTAAVPPAVTPPAGNEVKIFTEDEIWQKIVGLEPGSTAFFYLAGSPATGGPLGRGAAIVELNPKYPGKKEKRYVLYTDDVDGGQPVGKRHRFLDSDSSRELAKWIKERHYKPTSG